MKVFASPVPYTANDDWDNWQKNEAEHMATLKQHLIDKGYTGRNTGGIYREHIADGYAQYMLADGKGAYGPSFLVHLEYGDAYQSPNVQYVPKTAIVARIKQEERLAAIFSEKKGVA